MNLYIYRDNQQSGPFEAGDVMAQLQSGVLSPDDLGCPIGATNWQRLGELFPQITAKPTAAPVVSAIDVQPAKKSGCLKGSLIGLGLLGLFLGVVVAAGSRFIPSVSCDLAEADSRRIEKLRSDLDKATKSGDFDKIGPLKIELDSMLAGAEISQRHCNDDKFRNNLITAAGAIVAFIGILMALVGLFVGRGGKS